MTCRTNATADLREVPFASAGMAGGPIGDGVAEGVVLVDGAASIGAGAGGSAEQADAKTSTAARAAYRVRRDSDSGTDFPRLSPAGRWARHQTGMYLRARGPAEPVGQPVEKFCPGGTRTQ